MKKVIFATTNKNKVREVNMMMKDFDVELQTMGEAGINIDIVEDGKTFEENAIIKAKTIMEITGEIAIADDSGLEVDYLDGAPGIYSARFLGEDTSYDIKNNYIIDKLKDAKGKERSARFSLVQWQWLSQMEKLRHVKELLRGLLHMNKKELTVLVMIL